MFPHPELTVALVSLTAKRQLNVRSKGEGDEEVMGQVPGLHWKKVCWIFFCKGLVLHIFQVCRIFSACPLNQLSALVILLSALGVWPWGLAGVEAGEATDFLRVTRERGLPGLPPRQTQANMSAFLCSCFCRTAQSYSWALFWLW